MNVAYEHERDEWRSAVRLLTELGRFLEVEEPRRARGVIGDKDDAIADQAD